MRTAYSKVNCHRQLINETLEAKRFEEAQRSVFDGLQKLIFIAERRGTQMSSTIGGRIIEQFNEDHHHSSGTNGCPVTYIGSGIPETNEVEVESSLISSSS